MTAKGKTMTKSEYEAICGHIEVLRQVAHEYGGRTIENIITQLESRIKEYEKENHK